MSDLPVNTNDKQTMLSEKVNTDQYFDKLDDLVNIKINKKTPRHLVTAHLKGMDIVTRLILQQVQDDKPVQQAVGISINVSGEEAREVLSEAVVLNEESEND